MKSFFDWFRATGGAERPWLLMGKGPGFALRHSYDLHAFSTFGLNHVCREMPVDVAHAIDLDVIDQCGDRLLAHAGVLVMPWFPHVPDPMRPDWVPRKAITVSTRTLDELAAEHPILRLFARDGRLLWYNLATAPNPRDGSPIVPVKAFSAVAAVNLLGLAGARTVRSLGIDGGDAYSPEFDDLAGVTRLAGGQGAFDRQFPEIARAIMSTGVSYAPLDAETPIRVFVGSTEVQQLAVRVLEYSIRARTPMDVEVVPLYRTGLTIPEPRDPRNRGRTHFSFQRFLIPEAAGRRGRAIYMDSDMLVLEDLRPLWTLPFGEGPVREGPFQEGKTPAGDANMLAIRTQGDDPTARFSVLLLDCANLPWDITAIVRALDEGSLTYEQLVYQMDWGPRIAGTIDPRWNRLDTYAAGETSLLHYTAVHTQPWVSTEHPLAYLWMRELFAALDAGFISMAEIEAAVKAGYARPSLLPQALARLEDPLLLPARVRGQDLLFVEPFRLRSTTPISGLGRARLVARAAGRRAWRRSPLFRLRQWLGERW